MTDIGGTKTVYTPVTPSVDNHAKPTPARQSGTVSPGLLEPSPNTMWVKGVVKHDAESETKRAAFIAANGKMGDRDQYLVNQLDAALNQQFPQVQQAQREESSAGLSRISDPVEDARDSSKRSLDLEENHREQVTKAKEETLKELHKQDLLAEKKAQEHAASQA